MINKGQNDNKINLLYNEGLDILIINYSETITLDTGLIYMNIIEKKIREFSLRRNCIRLLFDLRNVKWQNQETHDKLSKIARKIFDPHNFDIIIYTAILNNEIEGLAFDNEHWFIRRDDAVKWLGNKS